MLQEAGNLLLLPADSHEHKNLQLSSRNASCWFSSSELSSSACMKHVWMKENEGGWLAAQQARPVSSGFNVSCSGCAWGDGPCGKTGDQWGAEAGNTSSPWCCLVLELRRDFTGTFLHTPLDEMNANLKSLLSVCGRLNASGFPFSTDF